MPGASTRRPGDYLVLVASVAMLLSSIPHAALGWPEMAQQLSAVQAGPALQSGLRIGWLFGSAAMLVFGLLGLLAFRALPTQAELARQVVAVVGVGYLLFGVWAVAASGGDPFFAVFIVPGTLLVLGGRLATRAGERT